MLLDTKIKPLLDKRVRKRIHEEACRRTPGRAGATTSLSQLCCGRVRLVETHNEAWPVTTRMYSLLDERRRLWVLDDIQSLHAARHGIDVFPTGASACRWLRVFSFICRSDGEPFLLLDSP
jgi:hypothetical protein